MKRAGQIALTPFPYTDLSGAKLRPVLLLRQASRRFDDWLVCMVSSQRKQTDADFVATGLKNRYAVWIAAIPQRQKRIDLRRDHAKTEGTARENKPRG